MGFCFSNDSDCYVSQTDFIHIFHTDSHYQLQVGWRSLSEDGTSNCHSLWHHAPAYTHAERNDYFIHQSEATADKGKRQI